MPPSLWQKPYVAFHASKASKSLIKRQCGRVSDSWNNGRKRNSWDNRSTQQIAPRLGFMLEQCYNTFCLHQLYSMPSHHFSCPESTEISNKKKGWNTIPCKTELKARILIENISSFSCKTITRAGQSPQCNHQSSLCSPRGHSFGAICSHLPHAPKIALRLPIKNIKRRRNNWWISNFPS